MIKPHEEVASSHRSNGSFAALPGRKAAKTNDSAQCRASRCSGGRFTLANCSILEMGWASSLDVEKWPTLKDPLEDSLKLPILLHVHVAWSSILGRKSQPTNTTTC